MIADAKKRLSESSDIAVIAHINEDADALGSVFALSDTLRSLGKSVKCYLDDIPESRLLFLGGEYTVYTPGNVPKHELCVALDCGDTGRFGERAEIFDNAMYTICIDHHKTNVGYAQCNIIRPEASATGEILFSLFKEWGFKISDYAAKCLYAAISSDSGGFKYSNTSADTMRIAADLMEYDFDHSEVARLLFDTEQIETLRLKGYVMNNIESFEDGRIQLVWTDEELLRRFGVHERDASDLVNIPRSVTGCEIAVELKKRKGKIRISLRANGSVDVSEIASHFDGGGHKRAAGATIDEDISMEEAKAAVLAECTRVLSV